MTTITPDNIAPLSHSIEDYPDGIVLAVDKPYRWTSADVIRKVKWLACRHFGKKNLKVGHAGTLDPLATGVLLVCIGNATKRAEQLQAHDKEYIAGISFGATTPSYDLEKDIDRRFPTNKISESSVRETLKSFLGEQEQVAPLFSAKSVDGVRAYELARKLYRKQRSASYEAEAFHADPNNAENISDAPKQDAPEQDAPKQDASKQDASGSAEEQSQSVFDTHAAELIRTSRIRIDKLELMNFSPDGTPAHAPSMSPDYSGMNEQEIARAKEKDSRINIVDITPLHLPLAEVRISCTKGTYIRAFARDLGEALDSGAFLSYLIRSRSGDYPLSQALTMAQVSALFQD